LLLPISSTFGIHLNVLQCFKIVCWLSFDLFNRILSRKNSSENRRSYNLYKLFTAQYPSNN
jgi:hypothetical protein